MKSKKGQLSIGDAPSIVLIVGLVFLLMSSLAYVGLKYGDALATETTNSIVNETLTTVTEAGENFAVIGYRNVVCGAITGVRNATSGVTIPATNYTQTGCTVRAAANAGGYNNTNWRIDYSYTFDLASSATNVTDGMNTEISNNTSIAGIVLTISLVGIVLSVLIGIFIAARRDGL